MASQIESVTLVDMFYKELRFVVVYSFKMLKIVLIFDRQDPWETGHLNMVFLVMVGFKMTNGHK